MLLLGCLLAAFGLSAQINMPGKAKDLLKDKKEKPVKTEPATPAAEKPAATETRSTRPETTDKREDVAKKPEGRFSKAPQQGADDRYKPSEVELDFSSQPYAPAIAWASLLSSNCWYFNITTGEMSLNNMQVSFLPLKTKDGADVRYESYANTTPLLRMEVWNTGANSLVQTIHYSAKPATLPFYEMTRIEGFDYKTHAKLTEGNFELRFWAGTNHFYSYPFSVVKQQNPDPYAPVHDFYFLSNACPDWARVEFGPDGHFIFHFYLSHETTTIPNQARWEVTKPWKYLVKLYRDGKMVAVHRLQHVENKFEEGDLQTTNGVWKKFDATFHAYPPAGKGQGAGSRAFFLKDDMKDGSYTAEVWLKDQSGAETTHQYAFTVKNGAIVPAQQADRTQNADPLQFLEQGPGRFYVRKK